MSRPVVEVSPATALHARPRLFRALEEACSVELVAPRSATTPPAGRIFIETPAEQGSSPTLVLGGGTGAAVSATSVALADTPELDRYLRGWRIDDAELAGTPSLSAGMDDIILASVDRLPVWTSRAGTAHAALVADELGADEPLLARLTPGRFLALLPVVHFLWSLSTGGRSRPPVQAAFIMDDPNLHGARYGYLDFARIAAEAGPTPFHLTVAMIPFDRWLVRSEPARFFRERPDAFSLMVHGNNHTRHELDDGRDAESRLRMLAQALRRVRAFTSETGIPVAEVMAAPHGRCSEGSAVDMGRLGFESLCLSRTFPWLPRPPATQPLAGWAPADTSTAAPVLPRFPLTASPQELPLRAFLRQPLIPFGHHWDLADRPQLLNEWIEHIAGLGDVRWAPVGDISRAMVSAGIEGETMLVRPHTRVVETTVPEGVSRLVVETPPGSGYETVEVGQQGTWTALPRGEDATAVAPGTVSIRLRSVDAVDAGDVPAPPWSPWPATRRLLTEARDRSRPRLDAVRRR